MHLLGKITLAAAVIFGGLVGNATAATVNIAYKSYSKADTSQAIVLRDSFIGGGYVLAEDFEFGFKPCNGENGKNCSAGTILSSQLGSFTGFGGKISNGGSQVRPKDQIVVRTGAAGGYGRYNVTPGGSNWLDSNDREGIDWTFTAPGSFSFQKIAFMLTDLDDVGRIIFGISVNGGAAVTRPLSEVAGNSRLHLVTMMFDQPVQTFTMRMANGTGDGFGLDGARIAAMPAPVPLPAAGLLLLGTIGGLAAIARRRRTA